MLNGARPPFYQTKAQAHLGVCRGSLGYVERRSMLTGDPLFRVRQRRVAGDIPVWFPWGALPMRTTPVYRRCITGATPAYLRCGSAGAPNLYPGGSPGELLVVEALGAGKQRVSASPLLGAYRQGWQGTMWEKRHLRQPSQTPGGLAVRARLLRPISPPITRPTTRPPTPAPRPRFRANAFTPSNTGLSRKSVPT